MKRLHKVLYRHVQMCPQCNSPLNWYSYSDSKHTYYCSACFNFFEGEKKAIHAQVTEQVNKTIELHRQRGIHDELYSGVPTGVFFKPMWIKCIEFLLRRKWL